MVNAASSESMKEKSEEAAIDSRGWETIRMERGSTQVASMGLDGRPSCFCRESRSDALIACANKYCDHACFHFHCVGLTAPPKERWFCPNCAEGRGGRGVGEGLSSQDLVDIVVDKEADEDEGDKLFDAPFGGTSAPTVQNGEASKKIQYDPDVLNPPPYRRMFGC